MNNRREIEQRLNRFRLINEARQQALSSDQIGPELDFSTIRIGAQKLTDAALEIGQFEKANPNLGKKEYVLKAIANLDYDRLREISNFFYRVSGIYKRLIDYLANLYRYDWFVTPCCEDGVKAEKVKSDFFKVLKYLDDSSIKKFSTETFKKVLLNGVYYGYLNDTQDRIVVQELPIPFCRQSFISVGNRSVIEFDLRFFENNFKDDGVRERVLKMFPEEFGKAYKKWKNGTLPPDSTNKKSSWFAMDVTKTVRFTMGNGEWPPFIAVIPVIIDLGVAKEIDLKRMQQLLLKLIIQHLPLNKNGDMIFSLEESKEIHNNAVSMLGKAIGVDVLTTLADVNVESLLDSRSNNGDDELEKVERGVFNEMGTAQQLFNSDNSVALEKSIINDESSLMDLIIQLQDFYNDVLNVVFNKGTAKKDEKKKFEKVKYYFRFDFLLTTWYNYKELSKLYKEQMQLGHGKLLSQIALGQSQSLILYTLKFENEILHLGDLLQPPQMSSTVSGKDKNAGAGNNGANAGTGGNAPKSDKAGRPTNEEKGEPTSEKTAANKESKGNA